MTDEELVYALAMMAMGQRTHTAHRGRGRTYRNIAHDPAYDPRENPQHPLYRGPR